jgi:predicted enzyme related to lactoylglutathione lyase
MPRVVHFEIHVDNIDRAVKFYRDLLGWEITQWGGPSDYWLIKTGDDSQPGINGGLMQRKGSPPKDDCGFTSYICTVDVPDLDSYLSKAASLGGSVCMPKMAVPTIGWLGYVKDTEGNVVGMMQFDPGAK